MDVCLAKRLGVSCSVGREVMLGGSTYSFREWHCRGQHLRAHMPTRRTGRYKHTSITVLGLVDSPKRLSDGQAHEPAIGMDWQTGWPER